jgi:AcrR family transcriptional regulator
MTRAKAHYHHGDLRNALLEQAVRLVEEDGAERFSLREAARRVGVTANASYRHFSDRADLLKAVAEAGFARMEAHMAKALAAVPGTPRRRAAVERVKAAGRAYVDFAVSHPELLKVMFGAEGLPSLETTSATPRPTPVAMLADALDGLVAAGVLREGRRAGAELKAWVIVHGFARLVVEGVVGLQEKQARAAALESLFDFALMGLCGERPRSRTSPRLRARGATESRAKRPESPLARSSPPGVASSTRSATARRSRQARARSPPRGRRRVAA